MDNQISFKKKNNKILNLICLTIQLGSLVVAGLFFYITFSHRLAFIPCTMRTQTLNKVECYTENLDELKQDVDKLFGNPFYIIHYNSNLDVYILGQTNIYLRQIYIKKDIENWQFVFTLAHELVHLTKFTASERYCHLTAFQNLMASNNKYFKYVAQLWLNIDILGGIDHEYSFAGYVQNLYN